MGRLNHAHLVVPDKGVAAEWYGEHLGFEPVDALALWDEVGGPLQISADGGDTMLALFEGSEAAIEQAPRSDIAFSVDAEAFATFARSLPGALASPAGEPLRVDDLVDFDLCFAFDFVDPWGNRLELNCFDHEAVRRDLVEADGIVPGRKWPEGLGT